MAITRIAVALLIVGLVVGVVAGYGVGFITYQPQISQLQSDLSKTQSNLSETKSALSKSQSEAESLRGQLTETKNKLAATEAELTKAQTTIKSLETQLTGWEKNYTTLSSEYEKFKSDVTSLSNSLKKKLNLEAQFIHFLIHIERGETTEAASALLGLEPYVDAVGDAELSALWDEAYKFLVEGKPTEFNAKFADLMERNSTLIQSDLSKLDTILAS